MLIDFYGNVLPDLCSSQCNNGSDIGNGNS